MGGPVNIPSPPGETGTERRLVEEVRRVCGPPLAAFLLAGYGQDESAGGLSFYVTARKPGCPRRRFVRLCGDGSTGLPCGREPLVWAALVRELLGGESGEREVAMHPRRLLDLLGWEDTREGRRLVEHAVGKYASVDIVELRARRLGPFAVGPVSLTRLRPVAEHQAVTSLKGRDEEARLRLVFSHPFAEGLRSGGLFGAVWESVIAQSGEHG